MSRLFDKVVAAAARDKPERNVFKVFNAAKYLVEGAVAAHCDDFCVGLMRKFPCDFGCVARVLRFMHDIRHFFGIQQFFDRLQRFLAFSLAADGIYNNMIHGLLRKYCCIYFITRAARCQDLACFAGFVGRTT